MGGESVSDEHITMLLGMGFTDVDMVRKALELAKNDLNDAVAILTGEVNQAGFNTQQDVEMKEASQNCELSNNNLAVPQFGPQLEGTKVEDAIDITEDVTENIEMSIEEMPDEFPVTNLYELEDRVFTENWSIPYRKEESLARCLYGAMKQAHLQTAEKDEHCRKFLDRVLPECCNKLLCSQAVKKWTVDVHEGVFNMIQLFVDLAAVRLKYLPLPVKILASLSQAFDPDSEFHFKNRSRKWDRSYYEDLFGYEKCPAMSPPYNTYKEPYGWLVDLVNRFAFKGGIDGIINQIETAEKVTPSIYAMLLKPFGLCASYLNRDVVGYELGGAADKVVYYIKDLQADDMKEKEVDKVYDLLRTLHSICESLWPEKTSAVDELHLKTILKMLNLPHFNARMNALKELSKLIKEAEQQRWSNIAHHDVILRWLLEHKVISVAFSSNLHHVQYCEKLKKIVEFASTKISTEELTTIWKMQDGKHVTVVENIHNIIVSAAQNFTVDQLEHLITLLEMSWKEDEGRAKEKILLLIGKIGREIRDQKIVLKLLEMLWDMSHEDDLPLYLLNQAVQSHLDILTETSVVQTAVKTEYVAKCVHDIKQGSWVVPAIRHVLNNLQAATKQPFAKNARVRIQELQNQHSMLKLLCQSLSLCHKAFSSSVPSGSLSGDTVMNNMYTYAETVATHLKLILFLLKDGGLYLAWNRCKEIWDCLMLDPLNCDGCYETCFEWFVECLSDLQVEVQRDLFVSKLLKTEVKKIKETGFRCFKSYFESVNINEHKMKKNGQTFMIEKQDLTGISYLWQVILNSPYQNIADDATQYLINVSYSNLSSKLKKTDYASIHKKFMGDCCKRLECLLNQVKDGLAGIKEGKSNKTFKKPLPVKGSASVRSELFVSIERLLNLAYFYIVTVEDKYTLPRSFPPHGTCFHGSMINIHINCDAQKIEFDIATHGNEKLNVIRQKIASKLQVENIQIYKGDKLLSPSKDHKLLSQLEFDEKQNLRATIASIGIVSSSTEPLNLEEELSSPSKPSSMLEREKVLPSFIMAVDCKVFDKLYQLAALEEQRITTALKNLFFHLPTDNDVLEAIDIFSFQNPLSCSPGTRAGYASSSSSVLENYFKCSAPKMSTFRVLYNLQVLSSKLMPVNSQDTSPITHSFRENWLNAGGLSLIVNILLPDTLPSNADYELRQSCYYIILQLARFLLCGDGYESSLIYSYPTIRTYGQTTAGEQLTSNSSLSISSDFQATDISMNSSTPIKLPNSPKRMSQNVSVASSWPGTKTDQNGSPVSASQLSSSPGSAASCTPENGSVRKRFRSASVLDSVSPTVKMVIENLNETEFTETISSLVQVAWAAAAGQLQLNARQQNTPDEQDDMSSINSEDQLKAGLCLTKESVSNMDSVLANNSLELLVMCLQLRPKLLDVFYKLPNVKEFIIDILTGSPSTQVRTSAALQFSMLGNTPVVQSFTQHPKAFFMKILMKAHLPYWTVSGTIRGPTYRLLLQCQQFFELLCNIIYLLSQRQQIEYEIDVTKFLDEELTFLTNSDNVNVQLLQGHLKLIHVLFTCENANKDKIGQDFIDFLLKDFLFSASKLSHVNTTPSSFSIMDLNMNSYDFNCRKEAYNLLLTLSDRCSTNLCRIANELVEKNHLQLKSKEWNHQPPISSRPINGFVGLKNAGATCYMNSVLQQLYMLPGIHEAILKFDDVNMESSDDVLFQIQNIFGHLLESQTQYYIPEAFWKSFRLWGEPVNLHEQQDAFEFFTNITDQLNEKLKSLKKEEIFKTTFCGMFVDQKICKECSHTFEREEPFFSLPVTVNCGNLEASLEQFVHNEIMEGDNAYYCEKCCERRTTVKRTCIKTLPPVLVIQLKRFWYDWERNRAIKFDDYFRFPWVLDIEPYTQQGISRIEKESKSNGTPTELKPVKIITDNQYFYELVGVVVHSGQASAGHYYSFIKNRQNMIGEYNKWYKFNDISIESFDMTDETLEIECFGGEYQVSQQDSNNQYPENRIRNWNGYMLFYETMDKNRLLPGAALPALPAQDPRGQILGDVLRSYPSSPASSCSSNPPSPGSKDSCVHQLSALIRKGERKGLFNDNMPTNIKRKVNEQNIEFLGNRDIYNADYYQFVLQLCSSNLTGSFIPMTDEERTKQITEASLCGLRLSLHFLLNTYFKSIKSFRIDVDSWITTTETLLSSNSATCLWFLQFFTEEKGKDYLLPYLIECPDKEIREAFSNLLFLGCHHHLKHENVDMVGVDKLLCHLLHFLSRDVSQNLKQCKQYFEFFYKYACTSFMALSQIVEKNRFRLLVTFLLGNLKSITSEKASSHWTATQTQELYPLHNLLALIILNTDHAPYKTASTVTTAPATRMLFQYSEILEPNEDFREFIYGVYGGQYLMECFYACIELSQMRETFSEMIMQLCWCNIQYSIKFITQILLLLSKIQVNHIQPLFLLFSNVWSLQDPHQELRIQIGIDGSSDNNIEGLFSSIHGSSSNDKDARRAYQCIKFLIDASHKLKPVKDYFLQHSVKWQWAVDWLKEKMSGHTYRATQSNVTSDTRSSFQRTYSAQNTLAEATKLLTEIETHERSNKIHQNENSKMETSQVIIEEEET